MTSNCADVFAIQDEIAERVAGAIEPELLKTEGAQAAARHTGNMTAWDLVRQGTWHFHQVTRENHLKAENYFARLASSIPICPRRISGWAESVLAWFLTGGQIIRLQTYRRVCKRR